MGAVTLVSRDPKPIRLGTVINFTATTAVKSGAVVGIHATGVDWAVDTCLGGTAATGVTPVGIALYDAAAGAKVAVACYGSIVKVAAALDNADIDAGDFVSVSGATAGEVITKPANTDCFILGVALTDILRSDVGYILVTGPIYVGAGE